MNQKTEKPLSEFTDKQRKAYKIVMKASAKRRLTKPQVYKVIKSADIYERHRDLKETVKMLISNPNTPLKLSNSKVVNELAVKD